MVLHGIERAVGSAKKFLGCVAILRECRDARANRKGRALRFSGKTLADSRDDARRDVLVGFRQHQREFIATVPRGGVNRAGMAAQNLGDTHQRAAAGQMSVLIVDDLEAVHVEKHDAEWPLRAARTVKLRFENADKAPVIRQPREWISDGHRAHLLEKTSLIEQRSGKHDDIAERLAQLRQKERAVEELSGKSRRSVADDVERGHDKKRVIEKASGAFFVSVILEALAKTDRRDQEQRSGKQIP